MIRPIIVRTKADKHGRTDWAPGVLLRWDSTRGRYIGPGSIEATAGQVARWLGVYFERVTA